MVINERLYLTKIKRSPYWYAVYRESNNKNEIRRSTKTTDLQKATDFAYKLKFKIEAIQDSGIDFVTHHKFQKFANLAIRHMQESKISKPIHKDYIRVLTTHLIPYFGKQNITKITQGSFIKYFREQPTLSLTQLRTHQGAIKMAFNEALINDVVISIPPFPKVETKNVEVREQITTDELSEIYDNYDSFVDSSRNYKTTDVRAMMYNYIRVLVNTGIRAGEEMKFKFSDIVIENEKVFVRISKGKIKNSKKRNRLVALNDRAINAIIRAANIHNLFDIDYTESTDTKKVLAYLQKQDVNVFFVNGKFPTYEKTFTQMKAFLKLDSLQDKTLYSLRHTYITQSIYQGNNLAEIARRCGTSVEMIENHYSHVLDNKSNYKHVELNDYELTTKPYTY
ncbi:hypothetical protein BCV02_00660 [Vibrio breoganii]|uniref:tyrosine-type recombinase/integrase n=1 Tax=Vibrio breoganii TaxID=553239 RepID=UPI000C8289F2|nr:tyrosine-type recombinase/integrase [Vibrio breoganii]PMG06834.1 hypothetical protein BCV02_00660 [Vibrio breoganii]